MLRKQSRKPPKKQSPRKQSPKRRKSPRKQSPKRRKSVFSMKTDEHFPTVLGVNGGLIGDYSKTSNSDTELFNIFFNGDNNLEKGENVYFKVLKALFTTRLQDEYLDKKIKQKYRVKDIYNKSNKSVFKNIDDLKNNIDYDNDSIIIECGAPNKINHVWIYITNTNWTNTTHLINKYEYENVSFFGPVNTIGDQWLYECENLKNVDFTGLNILKRVRDSWMVNCRSLKNIDFTGLSSLESVSSEWLFSCEYLESINFNGLSSLKEVGAGWLMDCYGLKNIDFSGLSSLSIGKDWMTECTSLKTIIFNR